MSDALVSNVFLLQHLHKSNMPSKHDFSAGGVATQRDPLLGYDPTTEPAGGASTAVGGGGAASDLAGSNAARGSDPRAAGSYRAESDMLGSGAFAGSVTERGNALSSDSTALAERAGVYNSLNVQDTSATAADEVMALDATAKGSVDHRAGKSGREHYNAAGTADPVEAGSRGSTEGTLGGVGALDEEPAMRDNRGISSGAAGGGTGSRLGVAARCERQLTRSLRPSHHLTITGSCIGLRPAARPVERVNAQYHLFLSLDQH